MKRTPKIPPPPPKPFVWPRADPVALAAFDPATKECHMNCSRGGDDPRSMNEVKFMCDDCYPAIQAPKGPFCQSGGCPKKRHAATWIMFPTWSPMNVCDKVREWARTEGIPDERFAPSRRFPDEAFLPGGICDFENPLKPETEKRP